MLKNELTNDYVRERIANAGITTKNVTQEQLDSLLGYLQKELKKSDCFDGNYRMRCRKGKKYMHCKSDYFDKREAISFNEDGFIGFSGWASTKNTQPILRATLNWANNL